MTRPTGPVWEYLDQLRASLRTPDAGLILAEAEDHLRDAVAAGLAAGLTEFEAQHAAISSFGSLRAVVRAHQARRGRAAAVISDLAMAAWKLTWLFLLAYYASTLVAYADARMSLPSAGLQVVPPAGGHGTWIAANIAAGIVGLPLLVGYYLVRRSRRRRGRVQEMLVAGYFPLVAAIFFGGAATGLIMLKISVAAPVGRWPIFASLALAVGYAARMGLTLVRHRRGHADLPSWLSAQR
jgi:hypothetical protein